MEALRRGGELSRSDIFVLFGRHQSRNRIGEALGRLLVAGLVRMERCATGGRTAEVWHAR